MNNIFHKLNNRWTKFRLTPIRVFVFHQVSDTFDDTTMWPCDWTQTKVFKENILAFKQQYTFISLPEAYKHLKHDVIRFKKYAVLTADDGWASLNNILPWLAEQQIPITLFLNPQYLEGMHYQSRKTEKLLKQHDVMHIVAQYAPYVSIASHGWIHTDCCQMKQQQFSKSVQDSETYLSSFYGKIPFYAYSYGHHTKEYDAILWQQGLIPVLADGSVNYNDSNLIHRECIDDGYKIVVEDA